MGEYPAKLPIGGRVIRLCGYYRQPFNTVELLGLNRDKIVLLVVPARTAPDRAHDIMMTAAAPTNAATIDCLLNA